VLRQLNGARLGGRRVQSKLERAVIELLDD
jgi:hypothetical protein